MSGLTGQEIADAIIALGVDTVHAVMLEGEGITFHAEVVEVRHSGMGRIELVLGGDTYRSKEITLKRRDVTNTPLFDAIMSVVPVRKALEFPDLLDLVSKAYPDLSQTSIRSGIWMLLAGGYLNVTADQRVKRG